MKHKKFIIITLILIIFALTISKVILSSNKYLSNEQIPVLIYHHFLSDEEKRQYEPDKNYSISVSVFEQQMKYLKDNGYTSLTPMQMECFKEYKCKIPNKSFMITIDDGQESVLKYAKPILQKYGFNALSFVVSSRISDEPSKWDASLYQYISKQELISDDSIYFGSHSDDMHQIISNQKKLYTMTYDEIYNDVKKSKEVIDTIYFAYPFNTYNKDFTNALKSAGYKLAFRGQSKKTIQSENKYMISRIFVSDDISSFYEIFETNKYNQGVNS